MGFADRDYSRNRPAAPGFGQIRAWSVTTWLIAINVAVYLVDRVTGGKLWDLGAFSAASGVFGLQLWRFITFQFLHANKWHLFFNMLALYFFGPMVEQYLRPRKYLAFYLICGMAGAAMYMILLTLRFLYAGANTQLVGASAGIFGILVAAGAKVAPDTTVMLLIPPIPMRMRTLAWIMVGLAVFFVLDSGPNAGGEAAHLGGAALGFILIQRPELLNIFDPSPARRRKGKGWKMDDWR
ncbi:MAG TPA: rhomboid family intramembrane serine protease [Tepidisphaeraceae bacterium]|nr:rhomboid family intramembrane serine protease [Tepidisphaeraceae bacterium]